MVVIVGAQLRIGGGEGFLYSFRCEHGGLDAAELRHGIEPGVVVVPALQLGLGGRRRRCDGSDGEFDHLRRALLLAEVEYLAAQQPRRGGPGADRGHQLLRGKLRADQAEKLLFRQAVVAQRRVHGGPIELASRAAERRHREYRFAQRCVGHHDAQAVDFVGQGNLADHLLQSLVGHLLAQRRGDVLAARKFALGLRHGALEGVLELLRLDGLAAGLREPRGRADLAHHVADAPDYERDHHDPEEDADGPGFQIAAEGGQHRAVRSDAGRSIYGPRRGFASGGGAVAGNVRWRNSLGQNSAACSPLPWGRRFWLFQL